MADKEVLLSSPIGDVQYQSQASRDLMDGGPASELSDDWIKSNPILRAAR
jgi:hypothetical protein